MNEETKPTGPQTHSNQTPKTADVKAPEVKK